MKEIRFVSGEFGVSPVRAARFQTTEMDTCCALMPTSKALFLPQYAQAHRAGRTWMVDVEGRARVGSPLVNLCSDPVTFILYHRERAFKEFDQACRDYEHVVSWLRSVDAEFFERLAAGLRGKHC